MNHNDTNDTTVLERAQAMAKWVKSFGFAATVTHSGNVLVSLNNRAVTVSEVRFACHFNDELPMAQVDDAVIIKLFAGAQNGIGEVPALNS